VNDASKLNGMSEIDRVTDTESAQDLPVVETDKIEQLEKSLKPQGSMPRIVPIVWSLGLGLATGVFAHYLLYRLSLPTEPFIYAAF
jgi:hypothetical protein